MPGTDTDAATKQADAAIVAIGEELHERVSWCNSETHRAADLEEQGASRGEVEAIHEALRATTPRYHEILDFLRDTPAHTLEGLAVKASAVMAWLDPDGTGRPDEIESDGRVAWSLARDVLRMRGVGPSPDAELIALCAEHDRLEFEFLRLYHGPNRVADDDERDRLQAASGRSERQRELREAITSKRALTIEGMRAKARSAATWDLELGRAVDSTDGLIASLVHDLVGDYDPVAIARGTPASSENFSAAAVDRLEVGPRDLRTPILDLGRRVVEASKQMRDYDIHGALRDTATEDYAHLMNAAANDEVWACAGISCDLPATILPEVVVQLDAAFLLADGISSSVNGLTNDGSLSEDFARIKRALASAIRVLLSTPGAVIPDTVETDLKGSFGLVFTGEMPPVEASA